MLFYLLENIAIYFSDLILLLNLSVKHNLKISTLSKCFLISELQTIFKTQFLDIRTLHKYKIFY
jgi:hypothetical protein